MSPRIENPKELNLPLCAEDILREMFADYGRVVIKDEFGSGLSGSRVFLVRVIKIEDDKERSNFLAVVKLAHKILIEQEWAAYEEHIRYRLDDIAEIRGKPVLLPDCEWGGLWYRLLGSGIFDVVSLRRYWREVSLEQSLHVLKRLLKVITKLARGYELHTDFDLRPSFDLILPVNLLITGQSLPADAPRHLVSHETVSALSLQPGDNVRVEGFIIKKVHPVHQTVTLNLPFSITGQLASYCLHLRGMETITADQRDQIIAPLEGVVTQTRQSLLQAEAQEALGESVDLTTETVFLPDGTSLPNPLVQLPKLIEQLRTVNVKMGPVHRDLNLENILVDRDSPDANLIDFAEARRDYSLHDFLRLETEVMTKLLPEILREQKLSPAAIITNFYQQLHRATFHPDHPKSHPPHSALEQPFALLKAIRQAASEFLFELNDCIEYYRGLALYLISALKYGSLKEAPEAPLPKQVAFWGAAAAIGLLEALAAKEEVPPGDPVKLSNPYRGLEFFREEDAALFFGREDFNKELVEKVHKQALVAVIGPSGSGKSSVVQAGLIPQLRREKNWLIAIFQPGDRPFYNLAYELKLWQEPHLDPDERLRKTKNLADELQRGQIELRDVVEDLLRRNTSARLLLIVDQFEELYTLVPAKELRQRFLDTLLTAVKTQPPNRQPNFVLVLTLRADFLGQVLSYRPWADALQNADIKLGPMDRPELARAIDEPAKVEGRGVVFEAGLVTRILDDVGDEPGKLPLLEFALEQLWAKERQRELTHAAYDEIGGVEQALTKHAEGVYTRFSLEEQDRLRQIFIQLVQPGEGTQDTRRRASRTEVGEDNWDLVKRLADARLVVTGRQEFIKEKKIFTEETVEIAHEALISNWERLRRWMETDRAFRAWQERLRVDLRQWEDKDRDEGVLLRDPLLAEAKRWLTERETGLSQAEEEFIQLSIKLQEKEQRAARRRLQWLIVGLLAAVTIFAGLSIYTLQARNSAINAEATAEARRIEAEQAKEDADAGRLQAEAAQTEAEARRLETEEARSETEKQRLEAEHQRDLANARAISTQARNQLLNNDPQLAILLALAAQNSAVTDESVQVISEALQKYPPIATTLYGYEGSSSSSRLNDGNYIKTLTWSQDGARLSSANTVWDLNSGKPMQTTLGLPIVAVSPNGLKVALASRTNNEVIVWDVMSHKTVATLTGHTKAVQDVDFSPDGKYLASGAWDGSVVVWDIARNQPMAPLSGHNNQVWEISWSPDGKLLAGGSGYGDSKVKVWDVATGETLLTFKASDYAQIDRLIWSPNARWLVSDPDYDKSILWDVSTGRNVTPAQGSFFNNWSPNGTQLAFLTNDNIIVWNMLTDQADFTIDRTLGGNFNGVSGISWSPDGEKLALVSSGQVTVWELSTHQSIATLERGANIVAWSPDSKLLAASSSSRVFIFDVSLNQIIGDYKGHSGNIEDLAWSADGRRLASGSSDKTVVIWDIFDQIHPLTKFENYDKIAFNRNHSEVALTSEYTIKPRDIEQAEKILPPSANAIIAEAITVRDIEQGEEIATLTGHPGTVSELYWGQNDEKLVAIVDDKTAVVWNVSTGQIEATVTGHTAPITRVGWNKDWTRVAIGAADGKIIIWEVVNDQVLATFGKHTEPITELLWNTANTQLVSGTKNGLVILWDVVKGRELATIQGPPGELDDLSWSPDESWLLVSSRQGSDETAMVWDVEKGRSIFTLSGIRDVVFSKTQGQLVGATSFRDTTVVWDARQDRPLFTIDADAIWSPDSTRLATSTGLWDVSAGVPIARFTAEHALAFGLDGKLLINATQDDLIIGSAADGQVLEQLNGYTFGSLNSGGTQMLVEYENNIIVWDLAQNKAMTTLSGSSIPITGLVWSPDASKVIAANSLDIWEIANGKVIAKLEPVPWEISGVSWYPDSTKLIGSASSVGTLTVWDAKTGSKLTTLEGHTRPVKVMTFSPDGKWLATAGDDKTVIIWNVASGQAKYTFTGHIKPVANLAWSPQGDRLASLDSVRGFVNSDYRKAYIWDTVQGKLIAEFDAPDSGGVANSSLRWNSTGTQLAIDSGNTLWDVNKNQPIEGVWGQDLTGAYWSPDESYLVWTARNDYEITWDVASRSIISFTAKSQIEGRLSSDKTRTAIQLHDEDKIIVRDVKQNKEIASLDGYGKSVQSLVWSPDDTILALSLEGGDIVLWDMKSNRPSALLQGHLTTAYNLEWSPNGKLLISKSTDPDRRLIVWNITKSAVWYVAEATATLTGDYYSVYWSPNESYLIFTGEDKTTILDAKFASSPCQWISRDLSRQEWEQFFPEDTSYQRTCPNIPIYPDVIPPLLEKAETLVKAGDTAGGLELLEQAIDLDPSLDFNPKEVVSLYKAQGLFDEAMDALNSGDFDTVVTKLRAAVAASPTMLRGRTMDVMYIFPTLYREGVGLVPAGDLEKAISYIRTVAWLMPEPEHGWIYGGFATAAIESGRLKPVLDTYKRVEKDASPTEIPANFWNAFCWEGSLRGYAADVLSACERAVELAPDHGGIRDSRGLARALTDDYEGAIEDFEFFIEWANQRRGYEEAISKRTAWVAELKAEQNPFDEATLEVLRNEQ